MPRSKGGGISSAERERISRGMANREGRRWTDGRKKIRKAERKRATEKQRLRRRILVNLFSTMPGEFINAMSRRLTFSPVYFIFNLFLPPRGVIKAQE